MAVFERRPKHPERRQWGRLPNGSYGLGTSLDRTVCCRPPSCRPHKRNDASEREHDDAERDIKASGFRSSLLDRSRPIISLIPSKLLFEFMVALDLDRDLPRPVERRRRVIVARLSVSVLAMLRVRKDDVSMTICVACTRAELELLNVRFSISIS